MASEHGGPDPYAAPPPPPPPPPPPSYPSSVVTDAGPGAASSPGRSPGAGSVLLNVLWLVLAGFWLFLGYLLAGIVLCITIIGIPFGIQSFKLAGFALWPFGRAVVRRPRRSTTLSLVGNVLWFVLAGVWLAIEHLVVGVLLCITIIGIPLGVANFKLIPLALAPFGKDVVKKGSTSDPTLLAF